MDEQAAIQLCLTYQDPAGFEYLVRKYRREAFFHAISFLGNQDDAADACQESFIRAYRAMPRMKELDAFYPWFYRILRNYCFNTLQRKKTALKYQKEQKAHPDKDRDDAHPGTIYEQEEEKQLVLQTLDKLNPEFKEILTLKYLNEYSYEEITKTLEIPRGTVMSRLYYARKAFQKEYVKLQKESEK